MPLSAPNLDDRTFQDFVDEARTMIPRFCPEWTDHNLSDPGIAIVEVFAWLAETILYRLNQVPERHYVKFLDLMGIKLREPQPARADISFRLTAAQPNRVIIPRGTEIATVRTESQDAVSFTTERDLAIEVATLREVLVTRDGSSFFDARNAIERGQEVPIFADPPEEGNALYIGHIEELAAQTLALRFTCELEGVGVDPRDPPLAWECWSADDDGWVPLDVESDTTGGLNRAGTIVRHVPYEPSRSAVNGQEASWVRVRLLRPRQNQRGYSASPQVTGLSTEIIGGTVPAGHGLPLRNLPLGRSDGTPNQTFRLSNYPLLPRQEGETVEVEDESGEWEAWREVPDFSESGPNDPHFVCDSASGEIRFGPSVRGPDGTDLQYGRLPRRGSLVRMAEYRVGGGAHGNVGRNTLTVLKSSIPYVAAVRNRYGAQGGEDGETLEQAKLRAPKVLRSSEVAITASDFEACALAACDQVARAYCVGAGQDDPASHGVTLLIVPKVHVNGSPVGDEELTISRRLEDDIRTYLEDRRPLTVELAVAPPAYVRVGIESTVRGKRGVASESIETAVKDIFYRFLHPTAGGPDGKGLPLGRPLFAAEMLAQLQAAAGMDFVTQLQIRVFDPETGLYGAPVENVAPPPLGLLIAGACSVTVER
jgi:predicted phage baseplate assembly protein